MPLAIPLPAVTFESVGVCSEHEEKSRVIGIGGPLRRYELGVTDERWKIYRVRNFGYGWRVGLRVVLRPSKVCGLEPLYGRGLDRRASPFLMAGHTGDV